MDELRNQFGGECKNCGSKKKLEFAHILPTKLCGINSRGSSERYYDIKKNPSSYVLLCSICHARIGHTTEMTEAHKIMTEKLNKRRRFFTRDKDWRSLSRSEQNMVFKWCILLHNHDVQDNFLANECLYR